eukprot:CAMPEP_0171924926 /NCGR_PEP_ID=MMETSP0993-20121228/23444_1 /TAXON_ID=483369 /ORGANISM="non described non described, Strain CCMP2098" /LENGTH=543 /DNA_ID=CAMNT_0012563343 /DNA_START=99 /DNA_END=1731 /DNA_ORIENTATION=+
MGACLNMAVCCSLSTRDGRPRGVRRGRVAGHEAAKSFRGPERAVVHHVRGFPKALPLRVPPLQQLPRGALHVEALELPVRARVPLAAGRARLLLVHVALDLPLPRHGGDGGRAWGGEPARHLSAHVVVRGHQLVRVVLGTVSKDARVGTLSKLLMRSIGILDGLVAVPKDGLKPLAGFAELVAEPARGRGAEHVRAGALPARVGQAARCGPTPAFEVKLVPRVLHAAVVPVVGVGLAVEIHALIEPVKRLVVADAVPDPRFGHGWAHVPPNPFRVVGVVPEARRALPALRHMDREAHLESKAVAAVEAARRAVQVNCVVPAVRVEPASVAEPVPEPVPRHFHSVAVREVHRRRSRRWQSRGRRSGHQGWHSCGQRRGEAGGHRGGSGGRVRAVVHVGAAPGCGGGLPAQAHSVQAVARVAHQARAVYRFVAVTTTPRIMRPRQGRVVVAPRVAASSPKSSSAVHSRAPMLWHSSRASAWGTWPLQPTRGASSDAPHTTADPQGPAGHDNSEHSLLEHSMETVGTEVGTGVGIGVGWPVGSGVG